MSVPLANDVYFLRNLFFKLTVLVQNIPISLLDSHPSECYGVANVHGPSPSQQDEPPFIVQNILHTHLKTYKMLLIIAHRQTLFQNIILNCNLDIKNNDIRSDVDKITPTLKWQVRLRRQVNIFILNAPE